MQVRSRWRAVSVQLILCFVALSPLAGCRGKAAQPSTKPSARQAALTPEQRRKNVESFDYVWNTIKDKHWDPTLGGLDWNAVRDELRPKVEQAQTMAQARRGMSDMIHRLKQSHFGIIPASVYDDVDAKADASKDASTDAQANQVAKPRKKGDGTIGADVRLIDDKAVITKVDPQLTAAASGVKPGWEIVAVDGRKVAPLVGRLRANLPDNNLKHTMLTASLGALTHGPVGDSATFTFRDGRGRSVKKQVTFAQPSGSKATFGNMPTMYVDFESRRIEPNVGYVAFKPFLDPEMVMGKFAAAMEQYKDADGIILDLRGNPGGIGAMAMGIGNFFVSKPNQRLGAMNSRTGTLNFVLNPRAGAYEGPLAVLVDEMSMSTSEILAGGLQDLGRAQVFGTRTPGAALPSVVERLPNGDGFQYAIANYTSAGGKPLEGTGVTPAVVVAPDRSSLLHGRDPVIDAAVAWIASQKKSPVSN